MKQNTVFIVDDDPIVRGGLAFLLNRVPSINLIGQASSAETALRKIKETQPDLVLSDIRLPGRSGVILANVVKEVAPNCRIVLMSASDQIEHKLQLGQLQIDFVRKEDLAEDIVGVLNGAFGIKEAGNTPLSRREKQVCRLVAKGQDNFAIAETLGIAVGSVKTYVARSMQKLDVKTRVELVVSSYKFSDESYEP